MTVIVHAGDAAPQSHRRDPCSAVCSILRAYGGRRRNRPQSWGGMKQDLPCACSCLLCRPLHPDLPCCPRCPYLCVGAPPRCPARCCLLCPYWCGSQVLPCWAAPAQECPHPTVLLVCPYLCPIYPPPPPCKDSAFSLAGARPPRGGLVTALLPPLWRALPCTCGAPPSHAEFAGSPREGPLVGTPKLLMALSAGAALGASGNVCTVPPPLFMVVGVCRDSGAACSTAQRAQVPG